MKLQLSPILSWPGACGVRYLKMWYMEGWTRVREGEVCVCFVQQPHFSLTEL